MDFVCGVGIPDDELSVLRSGDEMSSVRRPVHSVNLCKVTFQSSFCLDAYSRDGLGLLLCDVAHCCEDTISSSLLESLYFRLAEQNLLLTGCVSKLFLPALDSVLQCLRIASRRRNLLLHLFILR